MRQFMEKLKNYADGKEFPFTVIIRDPLGNSFVSAPLGTFLPPELDKNLTLTDFERSWEEVNNEFILLFMMFFVIHTEPVSYWCCYRLRRTKNLD